MKARWRAPLLFAVSGVLALALDVAVLYALKAALGVYLARLLSFLCAATFTWWFSRRFTFPGPKPHGLLREYLGYLSAMAVGAAINYGVYAACVAGWPAAAAQPAIGVALGSLSGMLFNFTAASRLLQVRR